MKRHTQAMPLRFTYEGPELERAVAAGAPQLVYFFMTGCPACVQGRPMLEARIKALDEAGVFQNEVLAYDVSRGNGKCAPADAVNTVPRLRLFSNGQHTDIDFRQQQTNEEFVAQVKDLVRMGTFLQTILSF